MKKMKKFFKKVAILVVLLILANSNIGVVKARYEELKEPEYTESYKEWLKLSDEEKAKTIEPTKYKITGKGKNNTTTKALLSNDTISLKNMISVLKSNALSTDSKYNIADVLNLTVRNQEETNICWTFATISSLETNLGLKALNSGKNKNNISYDFSERHLAYSLSGESLNSAYKYAYNRNVSEGGNGLLATSYLTDGIGAVSEKKMPFENNEDSIDTDIVSSIKAETTVNDVIYFDTLKTSEALSTNEGKNELKNLQTAMKEHIINSGSIFCGIYMPSIKGDDTTDFQFENSAIYCPAENSEITQGNHAVSIVGWDDNYSASNFATTPAGNGVWIIKNSWGTELTYTADEIRKILVDSNVTGAEIATDEQIINAWVSGYKNFTADYDNKKVSMKVGDNGYFYISYYDEWVYYSLVGIVDSDNSVTYDNIYQLDELGAINSVSDESLNKTNVYMANVFKRTTTNTEKLTSVGISSFIAENVDIYVNPNGTDKTVSNLTKVASNVNLTAGYHTVDLENECELTGENFVIVVKINYDGVNDNYITFEDSTVSIMNDLAKSESNESFLTTEGYTNDNQWADFGKEIEGYYYGNFCIKGIIGKKDVEDNTDIPNDEDDNDIDTDSNSDSDTDNEMVVNSDFDEARAQLQEMSLTTDEDTIGINIKFTVTGIVPSGNADSLEYYYYLSSDENLTNIDEGKWIKASGYEEQEDGTYTITIVVNKEEQMDDAKENDLYIYLKEVATKDNKEFVKVSSGIKTVISSGGEISTETENSDDSDSEKKVVTYTPSSDNTLSSTTLPRTGNKKIKLIAIGTILILAIILFKRYRNLREVK